MSGTASFNANELKYSVRNANSCMIMIGDQPVGFGQSSSWDFGIETQPLFQIGSIKPQDIQQLKVTPSINIDMLMLTATGMKLAGYPQDISYYIMNNSFNIAVLDAPSATNNGSLTNTGNQITSILYLFVNCTASSFNFSIPANQVVSETLSFYAEDVFDSTGKNSLLSSNSAYQLAKTSVASAITSVI